MHEIHGHDDGTPSSSFSLLNTRINSGKEWNSLNIEHGPGFIAKIRRVVGGWVSKGWGWKHANIQEREAERDQFRQRQTVSSSHRHASFVCYASQEVSPSQMQRETELDMQETVSSSHRHAFCSSSQMQEDFCSSSQMNGEFVPPSAQVFNMALRDLTLLKRVPLGAVNGPAGCAGLRLRPVVEAG